MAHGSCDDFAAQMADRFTGALALSLGGRTHQIQRNTIADGLLRMPGSQDAPPDTAPAALRAGTTVGAVPGSSALIIGSGRSVFSGRTDVGR